MSRALDESVTVALLHEWTECTEGTYPDLDDVVVCAKCEERARRLFRVLDAANGRTPAGAA